MPPTDIPLFVTAGWFQVAQRYEQREPPRKVILTNNSQLPNHVEDTFSYLLNLIFPGVQSLPEEIPEAHSNEV